MCPFISFFVRIALSAVTKTNNFFIPTYDSDGRDTFGSSPQTLELAEGRFNALECPPVLGVERDINFMILRR